MSYQQGSSEEQGTPQHNADEEQGVGQQREAGPPHSHTVPPGTNFSTGGASSMSTSAHHNSWEPIYVRTSKCDFCSKRNPGVLQKCATCIIVICQDCVNNGQLQRDSKHAARDSAVTFDWTVPAKKSRSGPSFSRVRGAPQRAAPPPSTRRDSQDTISAADDSASEESPLAAKSKAQGKKRARGEDSNAGGDGPKKDRPALTTERTAARPVPDEPAHVSPAQPQQATEAPPSSGPSAPRGNHQGPATAPQEPNYPPPSQDLWRANQHAHNLAEHFRREMRVFEQVVGIWMSHPAMLQERRARGDMAALQSLQREAIRLGQENHLRPDHMALIYLNGLRTVIGQQGYN